MNILKIFHLCCVKYRYLNSITVLNEHYVKSAKENREKESRWVVFINIATVFLKCDLSWMIPTSALHDLNVITGCAKKCRICVIK